MELVYEYAKDVEDITSSEAVFAHVGRSKYAVRDKTLADIRTAIEELAADAARYRWMRATTNYVTSKGKKIDVRGNPHLWDEAIDATMKESA